MERGAWEELPAGVYARGFLRNYAIYLGLDPDEVLAAWARERGEVPVEPSIVVPRPIEAPRKGVVLGPGIIVAGLVTLGALAIIAYIGFQLLRFSEPPTLGVTDPPAAVTEVAEDTTSYTLRGTTVAKGEVTIRAPGREDLTVIAGSDGTWRAVVDLRRGENRFIVSAADPSTGKEAEKPMEIVITVPFTQVAAPTLELTSPEDGLSVENGAIPVRGTATDATSVSVSAAYVGRAPGQGKTPSPTPASIPAAKVTVAKDGTFATAVDLTEGRWTITVTAAGEQGKLDDAHAERHRGLQGDHGRDPGQGIAHVAQGVGGRRGLARHGGRRKGLHGRQDAHVPRRAPRGAPDRQDEHDVRHRQRDGVRRPRLQRQPRHLHAGARKGSSALELREVVAERALQVLAERLQAVCVAAHLRVAVAESCTGGRVGDALTDVAGSSAYLAGGVIAYEDAAKEALLGVPASALAAHGAVSAQVARAMAEGARARLATDLAVAVTGIAGPGGATPGKPVGLAYVAVADTTGSAVRRFAWTGDREANKASSAQAALELLVERAEALAGERRAR